MLDVNHLCPRCMKIWKEKERPCPHCGFCWEGMKTDTRLLPAFTIVGARYLLGCCLGAGGFGITYITVDLEKERTAAVKEFFPMKLARREGEQVLPVSAEWERGFREAMRSFRKEAEALAGCQGIDGVVSYQNFFEENGTSYLVMDYVDGTSLMRCIREENRVFRQEEALELMRPILAAVSEMHRRGILHRDISPENLILGPDGRLTLIDFGAAREYSSFCEENLTVILKQGYAPEEQYHADGRQGPWTDIYACCAVLYQMISGILPQDSASRKRKDELAPLGQLPGICVTDSFSHAIEKGMSLNPEDRWNTMEELMAELYPQAEAKGFTAAEMPPAEPDDAPAPADEASAEPDERQGEAAPKARKLPVKLLAGAASVLLACAGIIVFWTGRKDTPSTEESMLPEVVFEDGKKINLADMETLSFTVGDASFELEIPSVLMKMCELCTESDRASIVMDTGHHSGTLFAIEKIGNETAAFRYHMPLTCTENSFFVLDMSAVNEIFGPNAEEEYTFLTGSDLQLIRECIQAIRLHTPAETITMDEFTAFCAGQNALSAKGFRYDWSLTLPAEMDGAVETAGGFVYKEESGIYYETAPVIVYSLEEDGSEPSEYVFQIAIGNVDAEDVDGWYPVKIAENAYLTLNTSYGVPITNDLEELLGSQEAVLSEAWNIMLNHLDGIVFTSENGEEISVSPLLLGTSEKMNPASAGLGVSLSLPQALVDKVQCTSSDTELSLSLNGMRLFTISCTDSPNENAVDLGNGVWLQPDYQYFTGLSGRVFPEGTELPDNWDDDWSDFYREDITLTRPDQTQIRLQTLLFNAQFQSSENTDNPQLYTDSKYGWSLEFPPELFGETGSLSWSESAPADGALRELSFLYITDSGITSALNILVYKENASGPEGWILTEIYKGNGIKILAQITDVKELIQENAYELFKQIHLTTPDGQVHYLWD